MSESSCRSPFIASQSRSKVQRTESSIALGEFFGTFLFLFFASTSTAVDVAILSDVGGGMFNAAFTAATCLVGLIRWDRAPYSITAQLFTSVLPSLVISALLPGPVTFNAALDPTVSIACGQFLEMFLTAQLVLTILMLPSRGAKPLYIGKALFTTEMASVLSTGSFLNSTGSCGPTSDRLSDLRLDLLAGTWLGCCARQWSSA
ncbi:Aquaporin-1-like protein 2 [Paraphaeosphaeria sporulosa]